MSVKEFRVRFDDEGRPVEVTAKNADPDPGQPSIGTKIFYLVTTAVVILFWLLHHLFS